MASGTVTCIPYPSTPMASNQTDPTTPVASTAPPTIRSFTYSVSLKDSVDVVDHHEAPPRDVGDRVPEGHFPEVRLVPSKHRAMTCTRGMPEVEAALYASQTGLKYNRLAKM